MVTRLSVVMAAVAGLAVSSDAATSVTFDTRAIEAGGRGPWMFSIVNPCTQWSPWCGGTGVIAYSSLVWKTTPSGTNQSPTLNCCATATGSGVATTSTCTDESLDVLSSTAGVTLAFEPHQLAGFMHTQVNGGFGDQRVYAGAGGAIKVSGVTRLAFSWSRFTLLVPYPGPCGAGGPIVANGWAEINAAASDPAWVAEFDPSGTGQVEIVMTSFSQVLQDCFGTYDCVFTVRPGAVREALCSRAVAPVGDPITTLVDLTCAQAALRFTAAQPGLDTAGQPDPAAVTAMANLVRTPPTGGLPGGVAAAIDGYWQISSLLSQFSCTVRLYPGDLLGPGDSANARILFRSPGAQNWTLLSGATWGRSAEGSYIESETVSALGEFTVGLTSVTGVRAVRPAPGLLHDRIETAPGGLAVTVARAGALRVSVFTLQGQRVAGVRRTRVAAGERVVLPVGTATQERIAVVESATGRRVVTMRPRVE